MKLTRHGCVLQFNWNKKVLAQRALCSLELYYKIGDFFLKIHWSICIIDLMHYVMSNNAKILTLKKTLQIRSVGVV